MRIGQLPEVTSQNNNPKNSLAASTKRWANSRKLIEEKIQKNTAKEEYWNSIPGMFETPKNSVIPKYCEKGLKNNGNGEKSVIRAKALLEELSQNQEQSQNQNHSGFFPENAYFPPHDLLLDEVMSIPGLPVHNIVLGKKPNQKYQEASSYLRLLQQGKLFIPILKSKVLTVSKTLLNDKWCEKFGITTRYASKKFNRQEILDTFREVAKTYLPMYDPLDKRPLPKTVAGIIFNSWSGSSLFLKVFVNGVKTVTEKLVEFNTNKMTPEVRNAMDLYVHSLQEAKGRKLNAEEKQSVYYLAKNMLNEFNTRLRFVDVPGWESFLGFVRDHVEWCESSKDGMGKTKNLQWLGPGLRADGQRQYAWADYLASRDVTEEMIEDSMPSESKGRKR